VWSKELKIAVNYFVQGEAGASLTAFPGSTWEREDEKREARGITEIEVESPRHSDGDENEKTYS